MKNFLKYFIFAITSFGFYNNIIAQTTQEVKLQKDNYFNLQKKNVIKFNVLSAIASEHIEISYERAIKSRQSIEFKIGLIGMGLIIHEKDIINTGTRTEKEFASVGSGMFFAGGYKFFFSNLVPSNENRKAHILKGWYLQPELIAGFYTRHKAQRLQPEFEDTIKKQKINYHAGILNLGVQGVIKNIFVFDLFCGVGIGNDNLDPRKNEWIYFGEFHRGIYKTNKGESLATRGGIKIGLLF